MDCVHFCSKSECQRANVPSKMSSVQPPVPPTPPIPHLVSFKPHAWLINGTVYGDPSRWLPIFQVMFLLTTCCLLFYCIKSLLWSVFNLQRGQWPNVCCRNHLNYQIVVVRLDSSFIFFSGWWYTYSSSKIWNGKDDIPYMKWNKNVWNHQPVLLHRSTHYLVFIKPRFCWQ